MRQIPIEYIERFSDALVEVDDRAKSQLRSALAKVDLSDVRAARAQIAAIMERVVGASDVLASTMAASFYDGIREYQLGEKMGATTDSGREPESTKNAVYGITSRLEGAEEPSISLVEALLVQRIGYEIQRSVGRTMYRNGDRDPIKPKFARIPLGGDSCNFCRMLASRGFDYNSELSAGKHNPDHYHDGCRCRVVCSWEKDPVIAGMDEHEYNLRAWDEYRSDAIAFSKADHSKHEQHRREKRRNRYTEDGKLKAGYSGLRIDKQAAYTEADRKKTAVRAAAQRGNTQRGSKRIGEKGITNKKQLLENASVNLEYIKSDAYRAKFDGLTGNPQADRQVYQSAVAMLTHRNGSALEDLHLISVLDGSVKGRSVSGKIPLEVEITPSITNAVARNPANTLFAIHNHPSNIPPTGSDFAASSARKYAGAVVVLHNGEVYYYRHGEAPFTSTVFDMTVASYERKGLSTIDATNRAMADFEGRFGITWRKI